MKSKNNKTHAFDVPSFLSRGYYVPMVLSNGVDFLQLDFSGTMEFKDHIKGYMSYWYKKERPFGPDPFGIVKLGYALISDKGPVEIGGFSQRFDPETAHLFTKVSMYQMEMDVESFLTEDHNFVELFRVTSFPNPDAMLRFVMHFPCYSYTHKPISTLSSIPGAVESFIEKETPTFRYRHADARGEYAGVGRSLLRILEGMGRVTHETAGKEGLQAILSFVSDLREGDRFMRVTTVVDSRDSADWENRAPHVKHLTSDPAELVLRHEQAWKDFSGSSQFRCSEAEVTRQFATSLYVCKASLHPGGSTVSALAIPNGHSMGTYWDVWFAHEALIRTNRVPEARRIVDFFVNAYPEARRVAKEYYAKDGARFEWVLHSDGTPVYYSDQLHNNLIPVLVLWAQTRLTDDVDLLREHFDLMQDAVRFVIQYALQKDESGSWHLRELTTVDESEKKKRDELLTTAITCKALDILREAAIVTGCTLDDDILAAHEPLKGILAGLAADGVYKPYEKGDSGTWAVILAYLHYPDAGRFPAALKQALPGCRESHGLGVGNVSRMRCATSPWVEGIFTWAMARSDDPHAYEYLRMMSRYVNYFGGMPEYVWEHGEPSRDWFVAAHGVYVTALAEACVRMRDNILTFFPLGIDALPWRSLSFSRFRMDGGLLVGCRYRKGHALKAEVFNDGKTRKEFEVCCQGGQMTDITLEAGETWKGSI
ncbi:MAG: hypothetical protein WCS96_06810 [Victivallales bacterium]